MNKEIIAKAKEEFFIWNDGVSDIDTAYNPETDKYDIPTVEWDGMYGRHWVKYANEQAMQKALDKHKAEMEQFITDYVKQYEREQTLLKQAKTLPNVATFTLGELFQKRIN